MTACTGPGPGSLQQLLGAGKLHTSALELPFYRHNHQPQAAIGRGECCRCHTSSILPRPDRTRLASDRSQALHNHLGLEGAVSSFRCVSHYTLPRTVSRPTALCQAPEAHGLGVCGRGHRQSCQGQSTPAHLCNIDSEKEVCSCPGPVRRGKGHLNWVYCLLLEVHIHPAFQFKKRQ